MSEIPAPMLHEHDGGRYIGTDDLVIMRDPEENWSTAASHSQKPPDSKSFRILSPLLAMRA